MINKQTLHALVCCLATLACSRCYCGGAEPAPWEVKINEEKLQRVARAIGAEFTWLKKPPAKPQKAPDDKTAESGIADMAANDAIIKSKGDFSFETKDGKEIMLLSKDVEIERAQAKTLIRGQRIRIVTDSITGDLERLESVGNVEMVTPDRKARGESLLYEVQYGPHHEEVKNMYTIEGKGNGGAKAILWLQDDMMEGEKFINDQRLDTFRIMGFPVAVIKLAPAPVIPGKPAAPTPPPSSGGMMPMIGLNGGKIRLQADGELFYEGSSGHVHLTRNVMIQQEATATQSGMLMYGDEANMVMTPPPPEQAAAASPPGATGGAASAGTTGGGGAFSGDLNTLECIGRAVIKTATHTVFCDRSLIDMPHKLLTMEMKNPKDTVRVYMLETPTTGKVLIAPKRLIVNMDTGEFESSSSHMESFNGPPPSREAAQVKTK